MRKKNISASKEAHRLRIEGRRERRQTAETARRQAAAREEAIRAALARPPTSAAYVLINRVLNDERTGQRAKRQRELFRVVLERAPRLIVEDTVPAFALMAENHWVRSPAEWQPAGKGKDTLFRSLAEHLFARFRMTPVLWTAFLAGESAPALARVAVHVAAGGSLYDAVQSGMMPVPLTRRICHDLLSRPGESSFLAAIRRAQVRAAGGDAALCGIWIHTRAGRRIHSRQDEEFWRTVLEWFCKNPMFPHAEVSPLVDFIEHWRAEDPGFSIKGRSMLAMLRGMRQWHGELARDRAVNGRRFAPSGFQPMDIDRSRHNVSGLRIREVWHVREILDSKSLADEGRAMSHCVFAYLRQIEAGECSIWTLTLEDDTGHWRRLTIEVRSSLRRVVQARGRFNRLPEERDMIALRAWAGRNNLQIPSASL